MELRNNVKQILQEKKKYNKKFTQKMAIYWIRYI